jgi:hypothetical protein
MPLNEQERLIGPLIKQVTDRLPAEKRKAYLLKPVANLTYESMIQTILEKDGITPEMLKEQQERVQVIERLLQASSADVRSEIIKQNINLFDEQFFALFSRLAQNAAGSGQESVARALVELQNQLLEETEFGRGLKESVGELEAATKALQEIGQGLTRETAGCCVSISRRCASACLCHHRARRHGLPVFSNPLGENRQSFRR